MLWWVTAFVSSNFNAACRFFTASSLSLSSKWAMPRAWWVNGLSGASWTAFLYERTAFLYYFSSQRASPSFTKASGFVGWSTAVIFNPAIGSSSDSFFLGEVELMNRMLAGLSTDISTGFGWNLFEIWVGYFGDFPSLICYVDCEWLILNFSRASVLAKEEVGCVAANKLGLAIECLCCYISFSSSDRGLTRLLIFRLL